MTSNTSIIHDSSQYLLPVLPNKGPYNKRYLDQILETLRWSLARFPHSLIVRCDLRLPSGSQERGGEISRFLASLKEKVSFNLGSRGVDVFGPPFTYMWVKEIGQDASNPHFHVALIFNRRHYFSLGQYPSEECPITNNLAGRIVSAWASVLGVPSEDVLGLVHFPRNCSYRISHTDADYMTLYDEVFKRLSYLAKLDTKEDVSGRSFGCSQGKKIKSGLSHE